MGEPRAIVAFSHLRWDWVYQRPQHLLSRFAISYHVFFIEEPKEAQPGDPDAWAFAEPEPGVTVCTPLTAATGRGFSADRMPALHGLMHALNSSLITHQSSLSHCIAWFYTPMALPLLQQLSPALVVYDCMDELSAFKDAPPDLIEREDQLFKLADVVFTGGPSLHRAKAQRHPNVHCYPSSVDVEHFGNARTPPTPPYQGGAGGVTADQAAIARPRLGYFGVIDERMDVALLDAVAAAEPSWQIVMIGPTTKIDPAALPRRRNIYYLGQKPYEALPGYLAGWDVCLLPFARNDATRFISPTKTLEYMAAEKPIVSTPIADVAEPYGDIVYLGDTPQSFVRGCRRALTESDSERRTRIARMRRVLAGTSWDATVAEMQSCMAQALRHRRARVARRSSRPLSLSKGIAHRSSLPSTPPVIVAGAGPTGLSAAYHLGEDALLLERNDRVGGWCRSLVDNGFTFDFAGHIMFSNDPYVHELYAKLLGDNVHWQDREAWIFSKNVYTRYPFQGALYGLPPDVIKECIIGAIEARYGSIKARTETPTGQTGRKRPQPSDNGHDDAHVRRSRDRLWWRECRTEDIEDCCGDGVLESTARLAELDGPAAGEPRNFEEFIYKVWGAGIAKHFAIPYNRKLWAVPLAEMETSWLGGRVPMPDLDEMIEGALKPAAKPMGPNARFGYPLRGGFQALMNGFLPYFRDRLWLNTAVVGVSPLRRSVTISDGREIPYEHLISTMPLPVLVRSMGDEAPQEIRAAAARLRYVSVRCVNIGVGREKLTEKHWIYYPEDTVFHRIFVQGNASPHCNPPGGSGLTCEITYAPSKPLPCEGDALIRRCIEDCRRVGLFGASDPIWAGNQVDLPHAYVVYDHARAANVKLIREWLAEQDIILAGRYSEWEYYNSDHAFIAGKKAAETVMRRREESRPQMAPMALMRGSDER